MALKDRILDYLQQFGPTSDGKLAGALDTSNQHVNQIARRLEAQGKIQRVQANSGKIHNQRVENGRPSIAAADSPKEKMVEAESVHVSHGGHLELERLGFLRVGHWVNGYGQLRLELERHRDAANILYAFIHDDELLYIGKTTQSLKKRMYGYQKPGPTQHTNIRNHELLESIISGGSSVEIHLLIDGGDFEYRGYRVSLAAGLEDTLIAKLKPPWNKQGV